MKRPTDEKGRVQCPGCTQFLEASAFYQRKSGHLSSRCKACTKKQVQESRDPNAHRAYMRRWMKEHRAND